jgi:sugar O-acyltransferase (sialic acid O-acetyltransferase NeuD family)
MSKTLLIYGAGGAGREFASALSLDKNPKTAWEVKGFIDDTEELQGKKINGLPVLGGFDYLMRYSGNIAVTILDDPRVRRNLILKIKKNKKIKFPVILSSESVVLDFVECGEGCIVAFPQNYIAVNVKLGDFVWINSRTGVGHDVTIGDYTTVFAGIDIGGGVSIGSECVIGSGAVILPKKKIGNGSIIGGGAVVTDDIPPNVVAAGVPAAIIRKRK